MSGMKVNFKAFKPTGCYYFIVVIGLGALLLNKLLLWCLLICFIV